MPGKSALNMLLYCLYPVNFQRSVRGNPIQDIGIFLWEKIHNFHSVTSYELESRCWLCFAISACYSHKQCQCVSTRTLYQGRACGSKTSMSNCPFHSKALSESKDNPWEVVELREATLFLPNMLVI